MGARQPSHGSAFGQAPHGSAFGQAPHGSAFGQAPHGSAFGQPFGGTAGNPFAPAPSSQAPWRSAPTGQPARYGSPYGGVSPFGGGGQPPFVPPPTGLAGGPGPRRRNPLAVTLVVLAGAIVVALAVLVSVTVVRGSGTAVADPSPPASTRLPSADTTSSEAPTSGASSPEPSWPPETSATSAPPSTTAPPSTRSTATRTTTSKPSTGASGIYRDHPALVANPIYRHKLGRWACPGLSNPAVPSGNAFRTYVTRSIDCMMTRYGAAVKAATGEALERPRIQFYTGTVETPCGTMPETVPFYCSANITIYASPSQVARYDDYVRLGAVHLLFHEFAHHVQYSVGLLSPGYVADLEDQNQVSRRIELQAECFTFAQETQLTNPAWTARDTREFDQWFSEDQDAQHGKASSYQYWFARMRGKGDLSLCNTWVAAKDKVA